MGNHQVSPRDVAAQYHVAANDHDAEAMVSLWEPGGTEVFPTYDLVLRAPDELRQYYEEVVFPAFPDVWWETITITTHEHHVVVRSVMHATHLGLFQGMIGTGKKFALETIDFLQIRDGRIVHNKVLVDGLASLRAIGAMPPANSRRERLLKSAFNTVTRIRRRVSRIQ